MEELNVSLGRTKEFENIVYALGEFINELPISAEQNNKLIELVLQQITEAEIGAFRFGIKIMGIALAIADKEKREIEESDLQKAYNMYLLQNKAEVDKHVH